MTQEEIKIEAELIQLINDNIEADDDGHLNIEHIAQVVEQWHTTELNRKLDKLLKKLDVKQIRDPRE